MLNTVFGYLQQAVITHTFKIFKRLKIKKLLVDKISIELKSNHFINTKGGGVFLNFEKF